MALADSAGTGVNAFREDDAEDRQDQELVEQARGGTQEALETLVRRHQRFLYNIAIRMLHNPAEAEDATQEILIRVITKLSTFEGRSRFRSWLYRIATNHLLNIKRGRKESTAITFAEYGRELDATPDEDLPDPREVPVDVRLLVDEARIGCTSAILLCLDRAQRLVYIMGDILGATDTMAAAALGMGRAAFRQKLARARRDLHSFMNEKCGLVNRDNPCRCERKTRAYMRAGYVDPEHLLFARERVQRVRDVADAYLERLTSYDGVCVDVYRDHPFHAPPDIAGRLRTLISSQEFRTSFQV
jgi:RNA polymerase sigma factor (sigma-70 family)